MAAILVEPPLVEPVSLSDAKAHMRVDGSDEDQLIGALITAARLLVERSAGLALITQKWSVLLDAWPDGQVIELPLAPVRSVDALKVYAEDDVSTLIDPAQYYADLASRPARLVRRSGVHWAPPGRMANGIGIDLTAGYGAAAGDVPETLRRAILLLSAHWFENRAAVDEGAVLREAPLAVQALLAPYRSIRL